MERNQSRGYSTAVKFDAQANAPFLERYCIEFLHRLTPDFVRMDRDFFHQLRKQDDSHERRSSLLSVIHGLDTELMVEGVTDENDDRLVKGLRAALVKGPYYEKTWADSMVPLSPRRLSA